ncbi:uncharacterized protein LOC127239234 isoform X2 [Andrographis paniculata]|uniref:uncharacterized protein LOC127239234 isoform X2 n=1 Tax=Andrographis paniculata TaxID=175694 RepID=UPI0021E8B2F2|nr:uncharacterized protein LOC127239234 isoform X2 [Andrographis paniculata]
MQVCHILIFIQEGSRFDTQLLKKFRVLQAAKHALAPYVRSQNLSPGKSRQRPSAHSNMSASRVSPNLTPGKSRGMLNRNNSAIAVMSGLGSYTSLLPGQCTPVLLFVFLDDFSESHPTGTIEETSETSQPSSSSSTNSSSRSGLPTKGSGSVLVLARPVNKSEGGLRKKLQSSLETQIRFSIKKCRTLLFFESSHSGSRNGGGSGSAPLFSLDASKAVSLIDASSCQSGESLEFAIGLVEEVLDGKATPDSLLLESHHQTTSKGDILLVKEFIHRQSDLLRGRGSIVANSNSGTAAGVGMVAAAAAAAAASTSASVASVRTISSPELPTFEIWLSSSQLILNGILSAKCAFRFDTEISSMHEPDTIPTAPENFATPSIPFETAISHLENSVGLNTKFSTLWCEKAFPIAKDVYLEGLPPCYPSSQHEEHLNKALHSLTSMVKGPSVPFYVKKLKDECTSIWNSGRQLCDAVSLTGKTCIHQRHNVEPLSANEIKPHSSGFVYLHACACGRSRQLRSDPFDYDTANLACGTFSDCDKLLPVVKFPEKSVKGPIQPSSWKLVRIGGARYYDPSRGLLQSGFSATQKFLLWLPVFLGKQSETNKIMLDNSHLVSAHTNAKVGTVVGERHASDAAWSGAGGNQYGAGEKVKLSSHMNGINGTIINANKQLPAFAMRKQFSEVVAGSGAAYSGFPPLSSTKKPLIESDKSVKLHLSQQKSLDKFNENAYHQESQKIKSLNSVHLVLNDNDNAGESNKCGDPFPCLGSNGVPVKLKSRESLNGASSVSHATVYMGFEHECPHGHRFILTLDHLDGLGSSYSESEEYVTPISVEKSMKRQDHGKLGKNGFHGRPRRQSNGTIMIGDSGRAKNTEKLANGNMRPNKTMQSTGRCKHQNENNKVPGYDKYHDSYSKSATLEDGSCAFSLLNRSLPIYMHCPRCMDPTANTQTSNVKFPSTISQLQRIFVVTPSLPIVLAADPVIQFESSCLPSSVPDREQKLRFSLGSPVILPPESFVSLRLPFIYGVELDDGSLHSLKPFENQPQLTAHIMKGTAFKVVSNGSSLDPA